MRTLLVAVITLMALCGSTLVDRANASSPPSMPAPSVRPFDPRIDRLARDSTPELNIAGDPRLPDLGAQRCVSGVAGHPWLAPYCSRR